MISLIYVVFVIAIRASKILKGWHYYSKAANTASYKTPKA
jgi:hypothetical protein